MMVESPEPRQRLSVWLGASLMVLSFGIYLAYPVVPFLSLSAWHKGGLAIALSLLSWGMFFLGSLLAGKEALGRLKQRFPGPRQRQVDRGQM